MRRGRCSRCRPPRRRRVLLLLLFRRQESTEGKTDQEYGTENLRHGRLDGGVVARHRPFFSEAFRVFLSLLQWGNLHLNLKHTTEATKEQPYHGSGVRERFRGRGESPPPTEEGEGGILRFRGIYYYVYLLFSFFFFFVALSSSSLLLFLEERFVCVGG
jgi:hypothetical protein